MVPAGGAVPAQPPGAPGAAAPKKKGSLGLIIGIVVALLLVGGGVAAYVMLFSAPKPQLAKYLPKDTQVYGEIPSLTKVMVALATSDVINAGELDTDKRLEAAEKGMAKAFKLSEEEAHAVLTSIESVGFGVRDPHKGGEPVVLIRFGDAGAVSTLLGSNRFDKDGDVGSGTKYELSAKEVEPDDLEDMKEEEKMFSFMSVKGDSESLVWFEGEKLMVVGDQKIIEDIADVIDKGKDNLEGTESYKAAQFDSGAQAMVFVDSELLDEVEGKEAKDLVKGFFSDVPPFTASAKVVNAGILMSAQGTLKGDKVPEKEAYTAAVDLDVYKRLPAETVAYVAWSSKSELSGKDAEKHLIRAVKGVNEDAADEFEKNLDAMDKEIGFGFDTIHDALGDQGALALVVSKKFKFDMEEFDPKDLMKDGGVMLVQHVGDKDAAEKIVKEIREKMEEKAEGAYSVKKDGAGFTAKAESDELPDIAVKFIEDQLFVGVGDKKMLKTLEGAVGGGEGTLEGDAAHKKAIGAFSGKPHLLVWTDMGRIGKSFLDGSEDIEKELKKSDVPIKAINLEGDDRITAAAALSVEPDGDGYRVRIDSLNGVALAPVGAIVAYIQLRSALSSAGGGDFGGGDEAFRVDTGAIECDENVRWLRDCASRIHDDELMGRAKVMQQAYIEMVGKDGLSSANDECRSLRPIVKSNQLCQ